MCKRPRDRLGLKGSFKGVELISTMVKLMLDCSSGWFSRNFYF